MLFFRIIEFLFIILIAMLARALLSSLVKGMRRASSTSFQNRATNPREATGSATSAGPQLGGELHKDPVCGTYVAESTPFRSQIGGQTFYFCSSDCREKYALVAR